MKPCDRRLIGVAFPTLGRERMDTIRRAAAPEYEIIDLSEPGGDDKIGNCEIIFGHLSPERLKKAAGLKWYHSQLAGVDALLKPEYGFPGGVTLTNSSGCYGVGISEHLITVTLMLLRRMGEYGRQQANREWRFAGKVGSLYGSFVTVVGLGDIGNEYAKRCRAMGATVRGVVRNARSETPGHIERLFTAGGIDEAINGADIVSLCLPGTADTKNILSRERMARMKRGVFILNIGRGTAIDHEALVELLISGHIGGAGLDVTDPEPLPTGSPLWGMGNVIITPHVSGGHSLSLTVDRIAEKFISYLVDYKAGVNFVREVDFTAGY